MVGGREGKALSLPVAMQMRHVLGALGVPGGVGLCYRTVRGLLLGVRAEGSGDWRQSVMRGGVAERLKEQGEPPHMLQVPSVKLKRGAAHWWPRSARVLHFTTPHRHRPSCYSRTQQQSPRGSP